MILTDEIQNALDTLSNAAQNDFELLAIERLYQALFNPPAIEIIDDRHQKFNGVTYTKQKGGHFLHYASIHRAVYQYYCGEIPDGYDIHHIDEDKDNNELDNLLCVTPADHRILHNLLDRFPDRKLHEFTCENCGKKYFSASNGRNRFCSPQCRILQEK